jgi:hypothetical protein
MEKHWKTRDQITGFQNRIKNRKAEILTVIRELKAEYCSLEQTENSLADILDEYVNEFENEESEGQND